MRKLITSLFCAALALSSVHAQRLMATVDIQPFHAPGTGNYIEVYALFDAATTRLAKVENDGLQAGVEVIYIWRKDGVIKDYRKKNVMSPVFKDSVIEAFKDQDRFVLESGTYEMEMQFTDLHDSMHIPLKAVRSYEIEDLGKKVRVSGIELLEGYSKADKPGPTTRSGYDLYPYIMNYYPEDIEKIAYYAEIYMSEHARKNHDVLLLSEYIEEINSGEKVENMGRMQKLKSAEVFPVLNAFDITMLPTGDYNLVIEVKNRENEVISLRKHLFKRSNEMTILTHDIVNAANIEGTFVQHITNEDTLNDYLACLKPIALNHEIDMIDAHLKSSNMINKKQFMYSFWQSRNQQHPSEAWATYFVEVKKANKFFSTRIRRGYATDRGRVFLKYGPPNDIADRPNEPSAYPYQIWHYYKSGKFNNKRFVFYMPDLVTNDYELLHSDVPGEFKNYRWEYVLHSRNSTNENIDAAGGGNFNHYGGRSGDFYRLPR